MLKAVQILGSSSGLIPLRLKKPHNAGGDLSFFSVSPKPVSPLSCSGSKKISNSVLLRAFSIRRTRFRSIRMYATRADSEPDGSSPSTSSSTSSLVGQSTVSAFLLLRHLKINRYCFNFLLCLYSFLECELIMRENENSFLAVLMIFTLLLHCCLG